MKKKKTPIERFLALPDAEKESQYSVFDKPLRVGPDGLPGKPLTAAERKLWAKAKRKIHRGRPKIGAGAAIVPMSIERGLLREVDAFAKAHGLKRSQMVVEGLRLVIKRRAG